MKQIFIYVAVRTTWTFSVISIIFYMTDETINFVRGNKRIKLATTIYFIYSIVSIKSK